MEHVWQDKLGVTVLRIFFKKFIENLPRFGAVVLEEVLSFLLQALRPLAARAQWCIKGKMTKQIEWIGFRLLGLFSQFVEADAALGKRCE